jgi:hypothetical protein
MEREEPIVAAYRNTYDVAVRGALRQGQVFVQPGRWGKCVNLVMLVIVAIGTIAAVIMAYVHDLFSELFGTPKDKVMLVVSLLCLAFAWSYTTKRGQRRYYKALTRLLFRWSRSSNRVVILTIDDEAIVTHVEGEDRRYYQMWRGLGKVVRTPDGFVLSAPDHWSIHWSMAWIPLEAFKSEQDIERFAQLARDNVREYVVLPE